MNILDKIMQVKKQEVRQLRSEYSPGRFGEMEFFDKKTADVISIFSESRDISVIAEIKKASPSKGLISRNFDPVKTVEIYSRNSADAVSVLTDKQFFQGSIKYLHNCAEITDLPLLRKDFIIDEYQILEAKANGADFILLICEALSAHQIKELTAAANETGLQVLLELHSIDQIDKIDFSLNKLIGVNNRDLTTFNVDIGTTGVVMQELPDECVIISESGISDKSDFDRLKQYGVDGVLIGESLMRAEDTAEALKKIKEWCRYES